MSNQHAWEQVRAKNPIVKRNAWVAYKGQNYRVASLTSVGHVVLRTETIVHPTDIETPNLDASGKIFRHIREAEQRIADREAMLAERPDLTETRLSLENERGFVSGLYAALRHMGIELAA